MRPWKDICTISYPDEDAFIDFHDREVSTKKNDGDDVTRICILPAASKLSEVLNIHCGLYLGEAGSCWEE